jgi:hypothetical protein
VGAGGWAIVGGWHPVVVKTHEFHVGDNPVGSDSVMGLFPA